MARPTIGDIAARAGVSIGAVSFALNGRAGVSEATRARILLVAEQMGWHPHSAARALSGAKSDMIGLVSARPARTLGVEPFFAQLLSGFTGRVVRCRALGSSCSSSRTSRPRWRPIANGARPTMSTAWSCSTCARTILGSPSWSGPSCPPSCSAATGPLESLPNVWVDDRAAMLRIVEYLAALGHQRIAHVAGLPEFWHTQRRIAALRDSADALKLLGATSTTTDFSDEQGAEVTRRLLARRPRPTAIVYDSDVMAVAGLGVAIEMGLSVPQDLSIVAFDDSVLARMMHPALTALSRDTFALGELVAETMLSAVDGAAEQRAGAHAGTGGAGEHRPAAEIAFRPVC